MFGKINYIYEEDIGFLNIFKTKIERKPIAIIKIMDEMFIIYKFMYL